MGKCQSVWEVSRGQSTMCLLRSGARQQTLGSCCVSAWGKLLTFTGRSAGDRRREGRNEEWRVSSSVMIQWGDSGISCSCYTTRTHTCTRAQNSLLAPHHSNYGTIKTRWHLIFGHFLRLNTANSGITFPLWPHSDFDVSLAPPQPSTCQPLIFPWSSSLDKARPSFETTLSDTLPSTSLSHRLPILPSYFIYLPTLESSPIQLVPLFPASHVPLCTPPPPAYPTAPLLNNRANFSHQCRQDNTAPRLFPRTENPAQPAASEQTRRQEFLQVIISQWRAEKWWEREWLAGEEGGREGWSYLTVSVITHVSKGV